MNTQEEKDVKDEGRIVRLETGFDNVVKAIDELKNYYNHALTDRLTGLDRSIGDINEKLNTRLPLWATALISILTTMTGVLLASFLKK